MGLEWDNHVLVIQGANPFTYLQKYDTVKSSLVSKISTLRYKTI